mgnify:CR=1 FL=1
MYKVLRVFLISLCEEVCCLFVDLIHVHVCVYMCVCVCVLYGVMSVAPLAQLKPWPELLASLPSLATSADPSHRALCFFLIDKVRVETHM